MKKIILLALLGVVLAGCTNEKRYKENFGKTLEEMQFVTHLSSIYRDGIVDVWSTAIFDNKYNGHYCSNFNEALSDYLPKIHDGEAFKKLAVKVDSIDFKVLELSDYPEKYKDAYNEIAELTPMVKEFFNCANSPSGNISSYSASSKDLFAKINNKIEAMKLKYINVK